MGNLGPDFGSLASLVSTQGSYSFEGWEWRKGSLASADRRGSGDRTGRLGREADGGARCEAGSPGPSCAGSDQYERLMASRFGVGRDREQGAPTWRASDQDFLRGFARDLLVPRARMSLIEKETISVVCTPSPSWGSSCLPNYPSAPPPLEGLNPEIAINPENKIYSPHGKYAPCSSHSCRSCCGFVAFPCSSLLFIIKLSGRTKPQLLHSGHQMTFKHHYLRP